MNTFSLTQARNRHGEVFDLAAAEPVLITKNKRPSHVVLSARQYRDLLARLERSEERALGRKAARALREDRMVGSERFEAALRRLANAKT